MLISINEKTLQNVLLMNKIKTMKEYNVRRFKYASMISR